VKVVLRHPSIGLYYAGRKHWVGSLASAADLRTIEQAMESSRQESFEEMDVVVTDEESSCELVFPLRRHKRDEAEPLRAAA